MTRVMITGSKGQLGTAFVDRLSGHAEVFGVDVDELDITDAARVREFVLRHRPTLILNCAAFNDVDGAERQPLAAYRLNAEAVWTLATLARESGAVLVHYSTDFVYDGHTDKPYTEDDEPSPLSIYGMTKLVGERYASLAPSSYVLRLSSLYGGHTRRTSVDWMIRQGLAGQRVPAFVDRTVSPSYVPDVVKATLELVGGSAPFGLYNCGSVDWCTWADLAARVLESCGRPDLLDPVPFAAAPNRAARPRNCAMSTARLGQIAITPRTWSDALADYLSRCRPDGDGLNARPPA